MSRRHSIEPPPSPLAGLRPAGLFVALSAVAAVGALVGLEIAHRAVGGTPTTPDRYYAAANGLRMGLLFGAVGALFHRWLFAPPTRALGVWSATFLIPALAVGLYAALLADA